MNGKQQVGWIFRETVYCMKHRPDPEWRFSDEAVIPIVLEDSEKGDCCDVCQELLVDESSFEPDPMRLAKGEA